MTKILLLCRSDRPWRAALAQPLAFSRSNGRRCLGSSPLPNLRSGHAHRQRRAARCRQSKRSLQYSTAIFGGQARAKESQLLPPALAPLIFDGLSPRSLMVCRTSRAKYCRTSRAQYIMRHMPTTGSGLMARHNITTPQKRTVFNWWGLSPASWHEAVACCSTLRCDVPPAARRFRPRRRRRMTWFANFRQHHKSNFRSRPPKARLNILAEGAIPPSMTLRRAARTLPTPREVDRQCVSRNSDVGVGPSRTTRSRCRGCWMLSARHVCRRRPALAAELPHLAPSRPLASNPGNRNGLRLPPRRLGI